MRRQVTRREFLAGAAALAATPALGALPASGEVEIAIVGAGAAGISAARRIAASGRSYALLEAAGRIGGRVKSGPGKFGIVHDQVRTGSMAAAGIRWFAAWAADGSGCTIRRRPAPYVDWPRSARQRVDDFTVALRRATAHRRHRRSGARRGGPRA